MKAELVPENGDPPIPISKDLTVVGRHPTCDVVIGDTSLSKRHCVLVKTDGLLVIRDLATTNGTKVKGQKIKWAALLPDDKISFGAYKLRVYLGSDEMPSPSEQRRSRYGGAPGAPRAVAASDLETALTDVAGGGPSARPAAAAAAGDRHPAVAGSFPEPSLHDQRIPRQDELPAHAIPQGAVDALDDDIDLPEFELLDDDEIIELT